MSVFASHNESEFFTRMTTGDGRVAYTLTGIVVGEPILGDVDWMRRQILFTVPVPQLQPGHVLNLDYWAPFVTLSSISNDRTATDAGWAVDAFAISAPNSPIRDKIGVKCNIAVRDVDGFIHRLAYNIHLIGREEEG